MPFVPVARAAEIPPGRGLFVDTTRGAVALFNAGGGRFHALGPVCPHEDGPLSEGWLEAGAAVCPWHGFDFELETGRCRVDPGLSVSVYPARLSGQTVEVDMP